MVSLRTIILLFAALALANGLSAAPGRKASSSRAAGSVKWELKYTENFDGKDLQSRLWNRIAGTADSGPDWQRNISSRADLSEVKNGELVLKGIRNDDPSSDPRRVLAGGVMTRGLFCMKYGKVEIRAKLKGQKGAWPAIWMMPQDPVGTWPECGEIDILERLNFDAFVYQTVHSTWARAHPNDPPNMGKGAAKPDSWNVYAIEWTPDLIVWRINGKATHSYRRISESHERWPWDTPFYLIIDMQLGGQWVGPVDESTLPTEMRIDWVKFYTLMIDGKRISEFTKPGRGSSKPPKGGR